LLLFFVVTSPVELGSCFTQKYLGALYGDREPIYVNSTQCLQIQAYFGMFYLFVWFVFGFTIIRA
jgi:hypothetical protein